MGRRGTGRYPACPHGGGPAPKRLRPSRPAPSPPSPPPSAAVALVTRRVHRSAAMVWPSTQWRWLRRSVSLFIEHATRVRGCATPVSPSRNGTMGKASPPRWWYVSIQPATIWWSTADLPPPEGNVNGPVCGDLRRVGGRADAAVVNGASDRCEGIGAPGCECRRDRVPTGRHPPSAADTPQQWSVLEGERGAKRGGPQVQEAPRSDGRDSCESPNTQSSALKPAPALINPLTRSGRGGQAPPHLFLLSVITPLLFGPLFLP